MSQFYKKNKGFTPIRDKSLTGFTIIEVIFSIFVVLIGILASYAVVQQIISYTSIASPRLVATYLSQEGIEIVRNIRDTNWIESAPSWNDGLGSGTWEADYHHNLSSWSGSGRYLYIEATSGLYGYDIGTQTKYKRKITIDDSETDVLKVSVEVSWTEKGKPYTVIAQENLYNWY